MVVLEGLVFLCELIGAGSVGSRGGFLVCWGCVRSVLVDIAGSVAALVVIRSLLLSVSFVVLYSGGPGRLHLVCKISVGLEILLLRQHFLHWGTGIQDSHLGDAFVTSCLSLWFLVLLGWSCSKHFDNTGRWEVFMRHLVDGPTMGSKWS